MLICKCSSYGNPSHDSKKFDDNYDAIFGKNKKVEKGSWIWDKEKQTYVTKQEYYSTHRNDEHKSDLPCPAIHTFTPYFNHAANKMVETKAEHNQIIKDYNLIEIGNEVDAFQRLSSSDDKADIADIQETVNTAIEMCKYGKGLKAEQAPSEYNPAIFNEE